MKIYGKNINILTYKIFLSQNILKTISILKKDNPKTLFITPLTTMSDIFNFKKESSIEKIISEIDYEYKNKLINEKYILELSSEINELIGCEIIIPEFEYNKLVKIILSISNEKVTQKNIESILKYISIYLSEINIVISGFNINIEKFQNICNYTLYLVSDIRGLINMKNIESLCIETKNDFFEIEDKDSLTSFLEYKINSVLSNKDLNDFLNGKINFQSFLIEKALKKLY